MIVAARVLIFLSVLCATPAAALDPIPFVRTPDTQFENLPDYLFEPNYLTVDGDLRLHYLDEGPAGGRPILLLHGEPSWSFLYRKLFPPLAAAGYRVIAPDLIGFGRSDKPTARTDYTHTRHVNWISELLLALDLQETTLFCQDWGGLIGLRLVALYPERFSAVIAGNTSLSGSPPVTIGPPSHPKPEGPTFAEWLEYSQTVAVFDTGLIIQGGTATAMPADVVEGYRAPFPDEDETYLAGARVFPTLVGSEFSENQAAWTVLQSWTKPFLTTFSDGDSITWGGELRFIQHVPGADGQPHVIIEDAGHFLQEDKGEEIAALMIDFLAAGELPVRSLKVSRLTKPAGEQKANLTSNEIDATAASFDPVVEGLSIESGEPGGLSVTWTIPPGDPDWKQSGRAYKWKAKSSPHPQGLSSLTIGRPGTLFKLKAKARDMDGLAITGLSAIEITLAIGDDVWSGPVPPCVLSGSGNTLNCR